MHSRSLAPSGKRVSECVDKGVGAPTCLHTEPVYHDSEEDSCTWWSETVFPPCVQSVYIPSCHGLPRMKSEQHFLITEISYGLLKGEHVYVCQSRYIAFWRNFANKQQSQCQL